MSSVVDVSALDASGLANLVRRKEITAVEVVEAAIRRLEQVNPVLNAVITPMFELARTQAAGPLPDAIFAGVPFLLKDLGPKYAGVPQSAGSELIRGFVPQHDSELVARQKRSGLIVIGKTNTPEFGILPTTEPRAFGATRNPWDTSRTTGGSSGGSAAAVAARVVPMAHANDGGGSIRIPASCCGVFGLKPTRARTPLGPDVGDLMNGLVVEHAVTRSVRDSAALLDATSGPDLGDPYWAPPPARPFADEVGADPGQLRIALSTIAPTTGQPAHPDCVAAARDAAALCADLGHEVTDAAPPLDGDLLVQTFMAVWAAGCGTAVDGLAFQSGRAVDLERVEPLTRALYEIGHRTSASEYLRAIALLQQLARQIARFFTSYDVWLTPTLAEPPVPVGTFDPPPGDPIQTVYRAAAFAAFTPICNVTGQPAMSVPLYWNAEGLPIGVHFAGRFGDEATLLRLAGQLEAARPWANRLPPIAADTPCPGT
ncbi:MAG: amidase [Acidobacteria bacterium]|nr:amidase [Acidobacteriota bacterium]